MEYHSVALLQVYANFRIEIMDEIASCVEFELADKTEKKLAQAEKDKDPRRQYKNIIAESIEADPELKGSKKKYALLFAYNGSRYKGLQINPGVETVEGELFKSLKPLGLVKASNIDTPQKFGFARAARTDKGVHALGQVVSLKLLLDINKTSRFVEKLNKNLPDDIKVFDCIRVANSFNAKFGCYGRKYLYYLPVEIFSGQSVNILLERLHAITSVFLGSKPYHHFTDKVAPNDPARMRYIKDVKVTLVQKNKLFQFLIEGQSFLFNQIRKMIAFAFGVLFSGLAKNVQEFKEYVQQEAQKAFSEEIGKVCLIPVAPGSGLLLKACLYPTYNEKFCKNGERRKINFEEPGIASRLRKEETKG
eukprot:augustus_masked-scaffold_4-processed-gene-15.30-mRNA-1 protein AED:0.31 eAED:0.32 QI:0/0/0/0.5/1/1/2/0/362